MHHIPFDKCGNVYALTTLTVSNAVKHLVNLNKQATDTHLLEPLIKLQSEIMLSLEKFQRCYSDVNASADLDELQDKME